MLVVRFAIGGLAEILNRLGRVSQFAMIGPCQRKESGIVSGWILNLFESAQALFIFGAAVKRQCEVVTQFVRIGLLRVELQCLPKFRCRRTILLKRDSVQSKICV